MTCTTPKVRDLFQRVRTGERRALAKTITLLESTLHHEEVEARALLSMLAPLAGHSIRLGISGSPGVGKSTFIEAFGQILLAEGMKLAILAIDPSSPISGGSILGDRVRMEDLSRHPNVFIRPTASRGTLGGTARRTREAILACEAAGFDGIIVETVGVGQSETEVASMTDLYIMLQLPNAGDEIQGIKKGSLELADLVAVTKADGSQVEAARLAKTTLERALSMARGGSCHQPIVQIISSLHGHGLKELWTSIKELVTQHKSTGQFSEKRTEQSLSWFRSELSHLLYERLMESPESSALFLQKKSEVLKGKSVASIAAFDLVEDFFAKALRFSRV